MNLSEELSKLQQLRQSGALSEEEYAKAKANLLNADSAGRPAGGPPAGAGSGLSAQQWCMFVHLSIFAGFVIPFAGLAVPIVLWQLKKNEIPEVDVHGKIVVNWIISALIYFMVCFLLTFLLIGVPLMFVLGVLCIVFPIVGGIKANNGETWKYPGSIAFLK
jgi:hypothetical protein